MPLAATPEAVAGWNERVEAFCAAHGLADELALHLALVFEEMLINIVRHGNAPGIEASLTLTAGELRGEVIDDGPAFDPLQAPPPDLDAALDDRPIGGLGIHLLRSLTDEARYERQDGRNRLIFVKRLP